MRHLAAAKAQCDLRLVALTQEADEVAQLDLIVAFVGPGAELHLLDLDLLQLQLGFVLLLGLPVLELAVVHDPANRGFGRRRDLDQIEFRRVRLGEGFRQGHDAELLASLSNQANLRGIDLSVDSRCFVLGYRSISMLEKNRPCSRVRASPQTLQRRAAASSWRRASKASTGTGPRSSPLRVRTATVLACISLSPTISWYGNFCRLCSRIL